MKTMTYEFGASAIAFPTLAATSAVFQGTRVSADVRALGGFAVGGGTTGRLRGARDFTLAPDSVVRRSVI